jgi:hypothetical protein
MESLIFCRDVDVVSSIVCDDECLNNTLDIDKLKLQLVRSSLDKFSYTNLNLVCFYSLRLIHVFNFILLYVYVFRIIVLYT